MPESIVDNTNLVGYINNDSGEADEIFLNELASLMKKHKIHKLDIGWKGNFELLTFAVT
jgi:hypothetical protein